MKSSSVVAHHCLSHTFPLVVASPGSDRVHMTPVCLRLWMHFWVPVIQMQKSSNAIAYHPTWYTALPIDFASRRQQYSSIYSLGDTKHIKGTKRVRLNRLYRIVLIMQRRSYSRGIVCINRWQDNMRGMIRRRLSLPGQARW